MKLIFECFEIANTSLTALLLVINRLHNLHWLIKNIFEDYIDYLKTILSTKVTNNKDICRCFCNFDTFKNECDCEFYFWGLK
jgi:hypothetical protein